MAGIGTAQVTIAFDAWKEVRIAPSTHEVAVVAPKTALKLEEVSARLKGELVHPNKPSLLMGLRFSPDGRRLVAGDYPGGIVVLWDVASGERLSTIETGYGLRGSAEYFFLSPDWRTLYVSREKSKYEPIEQDGKRMMRWEFDGNVRAWDLASGQLQRTYQRQPPRNVRAMQLFPDGTKFLTHEELPGLWEGRAKSAVSLWDVRTGEHRPLPDNLNYWSGKVSPDGRTLATSAVDSDSYTTALKLLDATNGQEKFSIPITDKNAQASVQAFTPDGRLMVGEISVYEQAKKWDHWQSRLIWWDPATGREVASFVGGKDENFSCRFSPDGQTLAVINGGPEMRKLILFRTADQKPTQTVILGKEGPGERLQVRGLAFHPDNRWIAVVTQRFPDGGEVDAKDVDQARIHLIDAAAGVIRETLIAPQGFGGSPVFSSDGKTLATSGYGRVLLWDLTKPPDSTGNER